MEDNNYISFLAIKFKKCLCAGKDFIFMAFLVEARHEIRTYNITFFSRNGSVLQPFCTISYPFRGSLLCHLLSRKWLQRKFEIPESKKGKKTLTTHKTWHLAKVVNGKIQSLLLITIGNEFDDLFNPIILMTQDINLKIK